ncbi:winged helix-turn-helix domain-containing protein [Mycolicibacterium sp.]|uniref:winged helix-turn-helix domain-containing protein n=1 Tax=Mycolicibacterium sp. TaxID=2320850 RepID=UPI0037C76FE3
MPIDVTATARKQLISAAALQRVATCELERAIYRASEAGLSSRQISDIATLSQPAVQRIVRRFTEDPSLQRPSPGEIIDRAAAGLIGRSEMMAQLLDRQYAAGHAARLGGVATDAYLRSDWDDVELAYYRGLLNADEFQRLAERHVRDG